jgi:hypothetical protein
MIFWCVCAFFDDFGGFGKLRSILTTVSDDGCLVVLKKVKGRKR